VSDQANPVRPEVSPDFPAETIQHPDSTEPSAGADAVEVLGGRAGLRPAPPPLEADTFTLVLVGIGLWAVAFLALLPVRHEHRLWLEICVAGFGLGLIGLFLSRKRRYRRGRPR
jgi:hypothetical protein